MTIKELEQRKRAQEREWERKKNKERFKRFLKEFREAFRAILNEIPPYEDEPNECHNTDIEDVNILKYTSN